MANIFVTGSYDNYGMTYCAFLEKEDGSRFRICGKLCGAKYETEVGAVAIAIRYAYKQGLEATVYTDFMNPVYWITGKYKATSQVSKEFVQFINKLKEKMPISVVYGIPEAKNRVFAYLFGDKRLTTDIVPANPFKDAEKGGSVLSGWRATIPCFRLAIYTADGKLFGEYDDGKFGGHIKDAVYMANWYEKESRKKDSAFYNCVVKRYNIPKEI